MAIRLGQWAFVGDLHTFVPEVPIARLAPDHIAQPIRGFEHTLAVMGPPNKQGLRPCIGYTTVGAP